jgi:hypothetical protein
VLDLQRCKTQQHEFYSNMRSDSDSFTVNAIQQFAFSDTELVPQLFQEFAVEYFNLERFRRVNLDELNNKLNELWEGPGSAAKISDMVWDIRISRREGKATTDALKGYETPTIDSELGEPAPEVEKEE